MSFLIFGLVSVWAKMFFYRCEILQWVIEWCLKLSHLEVSQDGHLFLLFKGPSRDSYRCLKMVISSCCSGCHLKMVGYAISQGVSRQSIIFSFQGAILRWLDMPSLHYESYLWGLHCPFHGPQCTCALLFTNLKKSLHVM